MSLPRRKLPQIEGVSATDDGRAVIAARLSRGPDQPLLHWRAGSFRYGKQPRESRSRIGKQSACRMRLGPSATVGSDRSGGPLGIIPVGVKRVGHSQRTKKGQL